MSEVDISKVVQQIPPMLSGGALTEALRNFEELTFQNGQKVVISVSGGETDGRTNQNDDAIAQ